VSPGEEGRLWVKTPTQSAGYWNDETVSAEALRDGWFDTGDDMKVDPDGYNWFCGRRKQIIVHDGSNISPQEVEDALLEHESVELAGVVGVIDEAHGENVRAYVEIKAPEEIVFIDKMR
jgi:long-chain acyl-CoA synthetase